MRARPAAGWWQIIVSAYALVVLTLFFSVSDLPLGKARILPLPPTTAAVLLLVPFPFFTVLQDFWLRRKSLTRGVVENNLRAIGGFAFVAFSSLLLALLPEAFWEEGAKWIFLISYGFIISLSAMFLPLQAGVRRIMPFALFLALSLLLGSIVYDATYPGTFSTILLRAAGFPGNSNFAALVAVLLCAASLDYHGKRWIWVDVAYITVTLFAITTTMSRSGFMNFALLMAVYGYNRFIRGGIDVRKVTGLIVALGMVGGAILITIPILMANTALFQQKTRLSRFLSNDQVDDGSAASRLGAVQDSIRLINESPIVGHGTGRSRKMEELPHNLYLQQWVNNGLPGVLGYLGMMIGAFTIFSRRRYYQGQAFILCALLGSVFSHNVLDQRPFLILFGYLLADSWVRAKEFAAPARTTPRREVYGASRRYGVDSSPSRPATAR